MGVLGALHEYLASKKTTKNLVEPLLIAHILPEFQSPHGFIRARACWVVQQFAGDIVWQNRQAQVQSAQSIVNCLGDQELPVQIQAAAALRFLIQSSEEEVEKMNKELEEGADLIQLGDHPVIQVIKSVLPQVLSAYFPFCIP